MFPKWSNFTLDTRVSGMKENSKSLYFIRNIIIKMKNANRMKQKIHRITSQDSSKSEWALLVCVLDSKDSFVFCTAISSMVLVSSSCKHSWALCIAIFLTFLLLLPWMLISFSFKLQSSAKVLVKELIYEVK